jgi:DNA-nicking Smr family endonuclease
MQNCPGGEGATILERRGGPIGWHVRAQRQRGCMGKRDPETELFREAVRDVRRLPKEAPQPARPKPVAEARFKRADEQAVLRESLGPVADPSTLETGDELSFRRPGIPETVLRKLRRGEYVVEGEIDLHGLTAIETRAVLRDFIGNAVARNLTCVRIIHGKGRRSGPRGPVLKNVVNAWLRQSSPVAAFGSARGVDGGSGAVYVLLKRHGS